MEIYELWFAKALNFNLNKATFSSYTVWVGLTLSTQMNRNDAIATNTISNPRNIWRLAFMPYRKTYKPIYILLLYNGKEKLCQRNSTWATASYLPNMQVLIKTLRRIYWVLMSFKMWFYQRLSTQNCTFSHMTNWIRQLNIHPGVTLCVRL